MLTRNGKYYQKRFILDSNGRPIHVHEEEITYVIGSGKHARSYLSHHRDGRITHDVANDALNRMEVDTYGLDEMDRKLLLTIIEKFEGGPVGVGTLSAAIHEEKDSIEEIIEPYLIQIGFLNRTPRGRTATRLAYEHFGIAPPQQQPPRPGLFDAE